MLAGVGSGNMLVNLVGMSVQIGFNMAMDTLQSQAAGAKNLENCGLLLHRGRFVLCMLIIPVWIILSNSKEILVGVGQDEEVAEYA